MAELAPDAAKRAQALHMLGYARSELGRRAEALAAEKEAVALYRDLAAAQPDAFRPDLAASLANPGYHLAAVGRHAEALKVTEEAVAIRRDLAAAQPDAFRPDLARSLNLLGDRLAALDRLEAALNAYEEALRTLLPFYLASPAAFADWIDYMVRDYVNACRALGREPDAGLLGQVGSGE